MSEPAVSHRSDAVAQLRAQRRRLLDGQSATQVPLEDIGGRVLAEPVIADADLPAHDVATMDGFAFDATDGYPLTVVDTEVFPEDDPPALAPGAAVPVATGAPLPERATAVLKREDADREGDRLAGPSLDPGTNVYPHGATVGEGETVFAAGERLSPWDAALLREMGRDAVPVADRFDVAVLATGTEIHEGVQPDRDSEMVAGLVRSWGHDPTLAGSVPDDSDRVRERVADLATDHDVVVTSGGTSVGHKDCVVAAIDGLGDLLFQGVAVRPGRPVSAARLDEAGTVVVALPGKPVAALLAATLVARPLWTGSSTLPTRSSRLRRALSVPGPDFEYAVPVTVTDEGAMPLGHVDSALPIYEERFRPGRLASSTRATRADAVWVTENGGEAGDAIDIVPLEVLG